MCDTERDFNATLLPINYASHISFVKSDLKAVYGNDFKKINKINEKEYRHIYVIFEMPLIKYYTLTGYYSRNYHIKIIYKKEFNYGKNEFSKS